MIGPLLGAFATIASGALGASATTQASDQNYNINLLNYYQRENERQQAITESRRQQGDTKLGMTDANGNRMHFVEGVGWVTDLADDQKTLQEMYQQEELNQLQNDLPKKREILNSNVERQRKEGTTADALKNAFERVARGNSGDFENQLNEASSRGITQGFDSTLQDAMQSAIRTGASNSGKVAASIGTARAKALQDAFMNNKINAKGQVDDQYTRERGDLANMYNMMATRSSAMPDVSFNPQNIAGMTGQQQSQAASMGQQSNGALINAFAKQGGSMTPVQANMGLANAVQSGGSALSAAFDSMAADKQRNAALAQYGQFSGIDPKMFQAGKGLW